MGSEITACENCIYLIEHIESHKWGKVCGLCGNTFEQLKMLEEIYWNDSEAWEKIKEKIKKSKEDKSII